MQSFFSDCKGQIFLHFLRFGQTMYEFQQHSTGTKTIFVPREHSFSMEKVTFSMQRPFFLEITCFLKKIFMYLVFWDHLLIGKKFLIFSTKIFFITWDHLFFLEKFSCCWSKTIFFLKVYLIFQKLFLAVVNVLESFGQGLAGFRTHIFRHLDKIIVILGKLRQVAWAILHLPKS